MCIFKSLRVIFYKYFKDPCLLVSRYSETLTLDLIFFIINICFGDTVQWHQHRQWHWKWQHSFKDPAEDIRSLMNLELNIEMLSL